MKSDLIADTAGMALPSKPAAAVADGRITAAPAAPGEPSIDPKVVHVPHLTVLDGWRGASIVFVLFAHLVPLWKDGNASVGLIGMSLFFTLSGFLITSFLLKPEATLRVFVIRRFVRIIPLAWLYLFIVFLFQIETPQSWLAHFLFYANLPPIHIRLATDHLWSLCVEMQFYVGVAILFALLRVRGLLLLPLIGIAVTLLRVGDHAYASSITWYRIDEILAGCTLALAFADRLGPLGPGALRAMRAVPQWIVGVLFLASCLYGDHASHVLNYLRPYLGAFLIGTTLARPEGSLAKALNHRALFYLASISYALYVIHVGLAATWLGSGDVIEKYAKRPLLLVALFALAHLSTFYYEHPFINLGKKFASRFARVRIIPSSP